MWTNIVGTTDSLRHCTFSCPDKKKQSMYLANIFFMFSELESFSRIFGASYRALCSTIYIYIYRYSICRENLNRIIIWIAIVIYRIFLFSMSTGSLFRQWYVQYVYTGWVFCILRHQNIAINTHRTKKIYCWGGKATPKKFTSYHKSWGCGIKS